VTFRPVKARAHGATKTLVAALIDAAGGAEEAAFLLERGVSQTYGYADPAVPDANISLDQARRLALAAKSPALAEALATDIGGYFTPGSRTGLSINELLARAETAQAQIVADYLRGLEAGTPPTNRDVLKLVDATLRALAELRAGLAA